MANRTRHKIRTHFARCEFVLRPHQSLRLLVKSERRGEVPVRVDLRPDEYSGGNGSRAGDKRRSHLRRVSVFLPPRRGRRSRRSCRRQSCMRARRRHAPGVSPRCCWKICWRRLSDTPTRAAAACTGRRSGPRIHCAAAWALSSDATRCLSTSRRMARSWPTSPWVENAFTNASAEVLSAASVRPV